MNTSFSKCDLSLLESPLNFVPLTTLSSPTAGDPDLPGFESLGLARPRESGRGGGSGAEEADSARPLSLGMLRSSPTSPESLCCTGLLFSPTDPDLCRPIAERSADAAAADDDDDDDDEDDDMCGGVVCAGDGTVVLAVVAAVEEGASLP